MLLSFFLFFFLLAKSIDTKPPAVFLIQIDGIATTRGAFGDQSTFFGNGTASVPELLLDLSSSLRSNSSMLAPSNAYAQRAMLAILSHQLTLRAGESIELSFAFGTLANDVTRQQTLNLAQTLRTINITELFISSQQTVKFKLSLSNVSCLYFKKEMDSQ